MNSRRRLLLTRPAEQSDAFAEALECRLPGRFETIISPVIAITPVTGVIDLEGVQALLFTSANGVARFAAREPCRSIPALCVGSMTAAAARETGFLTVHSADGDVEALAQLAVSRYDPTGGPLMHIRGQHAAGSLKSLLRAAGVPCRAAEIYSQSPCAISGKAKGLLESGLIPVLSFFSPRSAKIFSAQATESGWDLSQSVLVSLSQATENNLTGLPAQSRLIAPRPNRDGMLEALSRI